MATASRFVKKYTRKPTSQVKDEFFISTDDVNQVSQFKEKIEKMHQIQISFENNTEEGQWLILEGEPVDRKNAKSYITAICNPAEKKQVQFSSSSCSELTDPTTLEYIEKTTNAFIRPLKKIAQFEISGTELAVTLALSQIEELAGTAVVGKDSDQCNVSGDDHDEHDGMIVISPNTHNASSRLSTVLQRALSANSDGICSAEDYSKVAPAVKRVLVNCLQDDEQDDIDDDLLFADGKQESGNTDNFKRSNIMMFYEGDDSPRKVDEKTTEQTSPGISSIAKKVTELTVSNPSETRLYTKQQKYLRSFGISTGFKETEVEKALCFVHENTRPSDFLDMLNSIQNKEEINVSHENDSDEVIILGTETINDDSDDDVIILETETVNLVTDERQVVDETLKTKNKEKIGNESKTGDSVRLPRAQSQNSLPDGYKERLLQDFFTEDENCSLDELKKRNAERQKLLRQNFESKQRNDANQSNAQAQTGKKQNKKARNKGKKNKHQQQQQQLQQKSVENEGMHDKQFRLDTSKNDKASKDDDQTCVLRVWSKDQGSTSSGVGQSSDEPPQTTPKRKGRNNQQQQQKSQLVSENDNNTGIKHDPNNSGSQGWAQWIQPVGRGNKPTQIVTPVNTPLTDFNNMASQAQVGQAREDLRYIVIDGSNVAMTHGNGKHFSCKGIKICVEYFRQRGHKNITVFVPQWRQYQPSVTNMILDQDILYELKQEDILVFTPSRKIGRKLVVAYDDRFVLELAEAEDGIIVSNDQYRDLMNEKAAWKKLIEERLLMYSFVRDRFMPPNDPLGREGPCLDDYLRVPKVSPFPRYWQGCNTSNELQQQHSHQQYSYQQQSQHCQQQNQHYQQNQLFQSQQNYMYHQQFPQAKSHGHTHQGQGQFKSGQGHSQQIQPLFPMGKGNFAKAVIDENNQPFPKQITGARNKTTVHRQFEAQHLNETENVPNGTKQDQWKNTTQKGQWSLRGKGIPRTDEETEELFKELRIMFPDDDQEEKIRSVLANHDRERDLTKLTNYLMSVLF